MEKGKKRGGIVRVGEIFQRCGCEQMVNGRFFRVAVELNRGIQSCRFINHREKTSFLSFLSTSHQNSLNFLPHASTE